MTRVLVVSKALVASVYRQKLTALTRLGVEVIAVVPQVWKEGGREQRLELSDADEYRLVPSSLRWNGHFHLHYYPQLPEILRDVRPDLLHMDEEPYNIATWLGIRAARRVGIPSLFFSWQNIDRRYPPPFSWIEQSVYRMSAGALAGSDTVEGVLRGKGYSKTITVIPQFGVDPTVFHPCTDARRPFTVGMFNRLIPAKSPLECIEAFAKLPDSCRMVVVGDGPLREAVIDSIHNHALDDRVEMLPRVASSEMPNLMASVDTLLLFSRTTPTWKEQFGRVLIEGMASGAVVIGSDSGEIPWVIGDAGIVVPEGDLDRLTGALLELLADPERRANLAAAGRERVLKRFTNERIARVTLHAYERALQR